ncbi:MAG: nuclear transport factor 2 family protein [Woeseiaceae bacterium]|nr:nuclear transport factor 2 family protein [Woeseiaceae bacterium]
MSVEQNKKIVTKALAALAAADFDALLSMLADDFVFYVIGSSRFSGTFEGKQSFLDGVLVPMAAQRDESGYSEEILTMIGEGDYVAAESRGRKRTVAGKEYNNEYAYIFRFSGSNISEWRCYLDTQLLEDTHG